MNTVKGMALSIAAILAITGCGGSSSGDDTDPNDGQQEQSTTISGKAVDGYLQSATVCLDLNMDGYCQIGEEPATSTDSSGGYTLTVTAAQKAHANFDRASILVYDGKDSDTGLRFEGKLLAPNDGTSINVTPLTTLVAKSVEMATQGQTLTQEQLKAKINEAKQKVKTMLGIPDGVEVDGDPVALKAADETLAKAALALQKTIETFVTAAATSSTENTKNLTEAVFEAFAEGFNALDANATGGMDALIDSTVAAAGASGALDAKTLQAQETAKLIAEKIEIAFDSIDDSDGEDNELSQIHSLINADMNRFETAFESFDGTGDFNITGVVDTDTSVFNAEYDWKTEAYKVLLSGLDLTESERFSIMTASKNDGIEPWEMFTDVGKAKRAAAHATIYAALDSALQKEQAEFEEESAQEEIANSDTALKIELPFTFYGVWTGEEWDTGIEKLKYEYEKIEFTSDKTITFSEKEYDDLIGAWVFDEYEHEYDADYVLVDGKWTLETPENRTFTVNADESLSLPLWGETFALVKTEDLSSQTVYVSSIGMEVEMPAGAKQYYNKITADKDSYFLNGKAHNHSVVTSFSDLITHQCGSRYFISREESDDTGLAFAGSQDAYGSYVCDGTATSGTLVEASYDPSTGNTLTEDQGTWEIITIDGKEILVVKPLNAKAYSWDDRIEYPIFSMFDDGSGEVLWRGDMEPAGETRAWTSYNETAIEAIKTAIEYSGPGVPATPSDTGYTLEMLQGKTSYAVTKKTDGSVSISKNVFDMTTRDYYTYDGASGSYSFSDTAAFTVDSEGVLQIDKSIFGYTGTMNVHLISASATMNTVEVYIGTTKWADKWVFTTEQAALDYADALNAGDSSIEATAAGFTAEMLVGKTFYNAWGFENVVELDTYYFDSNGTLGISSSSSSKEPIAYAYRIENERVYFKQDIAGPEMYLIIKSQTAEYLIFEYADLDGQVYGELSRFYFTQADALANPDQVATVGDSQPATEPAP